MDYIKTFLFGTDRTYYLSIELSVYEGFSEFAVNAEKHGAFNFITDYIFNLENKTDAEKYKMVRIWVEANKKIDTFIKDTVDKEMFETEEEAMDRIENFYLPFFREVYNDVREKLELKDFNVM